MITSVNPDKLPSGVLEKLRRANHALTARYPGEPASRQPVHVVYGGAHLFKANTVQRMGELALSAVREHAPDPAAFAAAVGLPPSSALAEPVFTRTLEKLRREPVEDFRIDFEDGYGTRPDAEEDGHAVQVATELSRGLREGTLPPFIGIRIKPLTEEMRARSFRTLDVCLTALAQQAGDRFPNLIVTLPKVTVPEQVELLTALLELLESELRIPGGSLKMELMIETTQSVIAPDGAAALPRLVAAARGRCIGAHFGTYDYTAACNITAAHQRMSHPACDFAKHVMQVCLAGTGVVLSDGATNLMPIGPHRGSDLTEEQKEENRSVVHHAWRVAYADIQHSLVNGFYQGWDLHPAQLPVRYAAVYAFFLEGLDSAGRRLKSFIEKAAQATLLGDVFDDAATGQGLLNYFLRAMNCGAIGAEEAQKISGLTPEELRSRSFVKILAGRRR
ncbi:MAG TPA: phosphoenolpyruvate kinase [Myxococcaceae bacterium]|nr:phosphoenolpyruvate kinase [Myxococcaceae bacterium]